MKPIPAILIIAMLFLYVSNSYSQNVTDEDSINKTNFGLSAQFYPSGIIATLNAEHYIAEKSSLIFRLGGNFVDRKDFSDENDNEKGSGFGGSLGYRKHFPLKKGKIVLGLSIDAWNLWIDWRNNIGEVNAASGTTYTLVLQPWLESGYFFNLKNSFSKIGITAGFGREINAITNGKDVEQDWIASLLLQYQFSL